MGTRVRATGVVVGVLILVILGQPAKADTYQASGQTDFGYCSSGPLAGFPCSEVTFSLDFTTGPSTGPQDAVLNSFLPISTISGEIDGVSVSCLTNCGQLLDGHFGYAGPPIPDGG